MKMEALPRYTDSKTLAEQLSKPCLIPLTVKKEETTDPAATHLNIRKNHENSFLLESVRGPKNQTRYSIVGFDPLLHIKVENGGWSIDGSPEIVKKSEERLKNTGKCLDALEVLKISTFMDEMELIGLNIPRYILGAVGYLSYDYVKSLEKIGKSTKDDLDHPLLEFMLPSSILVFDKHENILYCASLMLLHENLDFENVYTDAIERLEGLRELPKNEAESIETSIETSTTIDKDDFEKKVRKVKNYIRSGEMIQTVLSRRIDLEPSPPLDRFYFNLRKINPSPYMFFLDFSERSVIGSSPEALVQVRGNEVQTRPIAGTRKRGKGKKEDEDLEEELLNDEKERAEHVMLVDLGRNDIGKISKCGSVETPEFMEIEKYGDVQHIVSKVKGELREDKDSFDALRAVFPAGTVTGAPKVRAMEIIEELEPTRRGIYSGAVGSFSYNGDSDFAISIRTLTSSDGSAHIQVGGGIVADSKPEEEFYETENKARSLMKAAGVKDETSGN